ncbi:hypothetical protein QE418_001523 [Microbacterium testaceum]|uniref:SCO7613 C-terminal domain-containing membrane protein n=1 Tax=Microbacterium TaxID=33882 RepID=UPI00277DC586|nr:MULTISPECIES: hypothetical protein [Microbacterium]MDQ1112075.1 hypothetical protein [Microbacterium testaceum]MDR6097390.1 hypothetical protein [Microbacterium sp. SORGH_AS_0454]
MTEVDGGAQLSGFAWPPGPGALVDTSRCPSCFAAITVSPCASCGLNLSDGRTARVLELSQRIVALVDERADVLMRVHRGAEAEAIRAEQERMPAAPASKLHPVLPPPVVTPASDPVTTASAASASVPTAPASIPALPASVPVTVADETFTPPSVPAIAPGPLVAPPATPPFAGGPPVLSTPPVAAESSKPRRSSVQVFLLSVGVVLLAVAAAFFLTVAWISGGLVLRSIVIGLVTAAIIATASLLRRRGLGATAEGIALLGIAFVALDVWAVRANDLGGAASLEPSVYWGATTVVAGAAFVGWARLSRLRAPLSVAVVALAVGPAMLVAGIFTRDAALGWYAWGLTLLLVALAAPLAPLLGRAPRPKLAVEIAVVRGLAGLGTVVALTAALIVDPRSTATPAVLGGVLALVLALHAWAFARRGDATLAPTAAVAAVIVVGVGIAATVVRAADATLAVTVPVLVASAIALALDTAARRVGAGLGRTTVVVASLAAAIAAGVAAILPLITASTAVGALLSRAALVFDRAALDIGIPDATSTAAVIALAAIVGLAAAVWRLSGAWADRRTPALIAAAGVALLAGPQLRVLVLVVAWYLVLAVVAVIVLRRRRGDIALAAIGGSLALGAGWLLSFSSPLAWGLATVVVAAVLAAVAGAHASLRVPSTVAVVLFLSGSALLVPGALRAGADVAIDGATPLTVALAVASLSLVAVVVSFARRFGLGDAQRGAGAVAALAVIVVVAGPALLFRMGTTSEVWMLVSALVAAGASAAVLTPPYRSWRVARPVAALMTPLLVAGAAGSGFRLIDALPLVPAIVYASIALVIAAGALRFLGDDPSTRSCVDVGTAFVAALSIVVVPSQGVRWVPLLFAAVTVVLWATDSDGLFRSRGPRRHLIWLALILGTLALWTRLVWQQTDTVELFTVPVGVAVLAIAAGQERARRLVAGRSVAGPAVIAAAGTTVALAPSALSAPDDLARVLVVAVVSVAVLMAGAWIRPPRTPDELPVAVGAAGALSLVLLTAMQLVHSADRGGVGVADLVVLVAAVAIGAAAVGVARRPAQWAPPSARHTVVAAAALLALGSTVLVAVDAGPIVRLVAAVVLLGAVGVTALRVRHPLVGVPLAITAHSGAALVALVGVGADVRPIEWATVPLALVWIAAAAAVVDRRRPVAAAPVLFAAGGLAVGLLPSAVLADASLVRTIGVTIAAIAVLAVALLVLRDALAPLAAPAIAVASLSLVVAAALRALHDLPAALFDVWMLAATLPLVGVAVLVRLRRPDVPASVPTALAIAAPAVAVALTAARLSATAEGPLRLVATLVAVLALGLWWSRAIVLWTTTGLSAVLALVALVLGSADPVEAATAPLAAALLVQGIRTLRLRPELRTWPALGVGLALLLVPSLLFDFSGGNALWRILALGVVALAVLLVGARFRWQAPVLLGGVVLVLHAVAQLWPWITSLYESASGLWWLWLGIAGVLLIVIAATYERRIREVKAVALAIRALR